jgi:hypothetical protein
MRMRPAADADWTATRSSPSTPPRVPFRPLGLERPTADRRVPRVDPQQRLYDDGSGRDVCEPLVVGRDHVRRGNDAPPEGRLIEAVGRPRLSPRGADVRPGPACPAAHDRALGCARSADAAVGASSNTDGLSAFAFPSGGVLRERGSATAGAFQIQACRPDRWVVSEQEVRGDDRDRGDRGGDSRRGKRLASVRARAAGPARAPTSPSGGGTRDRRTRNHAGRAWLTSGHWARIPRRRERDRRQRAQAAGLVSDRLSSRFMELPGWRRWSPRCPCDSSANLTRGIGAQLTASTATAATSSRSSRPRSTVCGPRPIRNPRRTAGPPARQAGGATA